MAAYSKTIPLEGPGDQPSAFVTVHGHNESFGSWVYASVRSGSSGHGAVESVVSLSPGNAVAFANELLAAARAAGWVDTEVDKSHEGTWRICGDD